MDNQTQKLTRGAKSRRKWRSRCIEQGLCVGCGRTPNTGGPPHMCEPCATRQKNYGTERRARAKSIGLCTLCGKNPPIVGRRLCSACVLYHKLSDLRSAGLSEAEVDRAHHAVINFQNLCDACGRNDCGRWCLDHDHDRKIFRGIVGNKCNLALGHARDNADTLRLLAAYIDRR
jgi:hypothetical protein